MRRDLLASQRWVRILSGLAALVLLAAFAPREEPLTVFLAGDSTMAPKEADRRPETGWGEVLPELLDAGRVRVENHARNGRSTRSFIQEGRWQAIVERLRPGDYVFIQFGHNDAAADREDRYTPPEDYRANLLRFVAEAREKRAHPVLLTPVMRRRFDAGGRFYDAHGEYPGIVRAVAAEHAVALIDMHRASREAIERYGEHGSTAMFLHLEPGEHPNYPDGLRDDTHFSPLGARVMAELAAEGIRALGVGLAAHLVPAKPVSR